MYEHRGVGDLFVPSGVACILRVAWQTDSPEVGAQTVGE